MKASFLKYVGQTNPYPSLLEIKRAEGLYLYDVDDRPYADLTSGICVSHLGHQHPDIQEAIHAQSIQYLHTQVYGEHIQQHQVALAMLIHESLPDGLDMTYFTNSGSEATEGAIKLARKVTGRAELIACRKGYHGSTLASMSLMSEDTYSLAYQPSLPGVSFIDFNDKDDLEMITHHTAAVILEPIQGPAGVRTPDADYLAALRRRCTEVGALLIYDEIQTAMGRTGQMYAFMHYPASTPDMLLLAKALGGGMPIGALVASRDLLDAFTHDPILGYISTFGGHPLCCAAGYAAFNHLIKHPELIEQSEAKARLIAEHLPCPSIRQIRYKGLMMAIDLGNEALVESVVLEAQREGLLLDRFLFDQNSFRIAPPLIISEEEIIRHMCHLNELISRLSDN